VKPSTSWCGGRCDGSKGTRVADIIIHFISPFGSNTVTITSVDAKKVRIRDFFFGEYCYLKQRKFEVRTGSDMFEQVRKNSTILEPRTAPGVRSGPLMLPEPELRFGLGSVQVRNRF
jgi:hypothetical protein